MTPWHGKRAVAVVSACMTADGCPAFVLHDVEVTHEEAENGVHYGLADACLLEKGYEEPFVHFAEEEAGEDFIAAIRDHLRHRGAADQPILLPEPEGT